MPVKLGEIATNFDAPTTQGDINFHDYLGESWGVLFSHPADFTPVCTTELGTLAKLKPEFDKRNVKVVAISVDDLDSHNKWLGDINRTQNTEVNFPIIADENKHVAELYDMINPGITDKVTVRSVFVIGPDKKVKLTITYPPSTGRNFVELIRVIDSLQLTSGFSVATPADWVNGEEVIILPSVSNEDAKVKFPKGFTEVTSYLRKTPQPNL
jgi:thioredoxin-dependent peroxiredoxin